MGFRFFTTFYHFLPLNTIKGLKRPNLAWSAALVVGPLPFVSIGISGLYCPY